MKVQITYTEEWRRVVDHDVDDDEFAEWWASEEEPTDGDFREFLRAGRDDIMDWGHSSYPGTQDGDEFQYADIDEVARS